VISVFGGGFGTRAVVFLAAGLVARFVERDFVVVAIQVILVKLFK
jgi:hypothetical protein